MTDLTKLLEQTRSKFEKADAAQKEAAIDLAAVRRTMRIAHPDHDEQVDPLPEMEIAHGDMRPSDLKGCITKQEAMIRMARANNGILMALPAAKMIVAIGLSTSKPKDLVANLTKQLHDDDQWEHAGPSMFRLLPNN